MMFLKTVLLLVCGAATALCADANPKRIVSLSPNTTEILYGVGAFPQVVAVSQYDTYPARVAKLPRVGGWQTSDAEKIIAMRPDLVVLTRPQAPFISDKLQAFSLHTLAVPADTLADVFQAIQMIGTATGHATQGSELAAQTRASLEKIRKTTSNAPRVTVLLVISRTPGSLGDMYAATKGSFLAELLEIAGGNSIVAPAPGGYGKVSKEALVSLNPDVIIDVVHTSQSNLGEHGSEVWNDLPELRAVRSKHVYALEDEFLVHPSQFVAHTAEVFEHLLHPELAGGH